ncbi:bacteriophage Gp15 family protein [Acetobacterium wieringae]|uniref:bacteriophage Gp15 family protein n=1 Tax=Acetobacterium wieringae TaxID=52694 RepID=UPI002033898C|nr:bacteriophage Gp15 family protein [Acetobacterium wieringae]URN85148.1 bacteriophage Gp15 family protein [Acetobacterium wieringae]
MNLLTRQLPQSVEIDGVEYPVNTDFRLMIEFEIITNGPGTTEEKGPKTLALVERFFNGRYIGNPDSAVEAFLWFYRCGEIPKKSRENALESIKTSRPVYSFDIDGALIYAAFMDQYRIDLVNVDYLHWWSFRSLMTALRDDHEFKKVMGYRAMKIDKNMTAEQRKAYKKLKQLYRLPDYRTEEEKESDFANSLDALF